MVKGQHSGVHRVSLGLLPAVLQQGYLVPIGVVWAVQVGSRPVLGMGHAWGKMYGTIRVDLERQRPIELLTDHTAETLATWLRAHPSMPIISRDRSTEDARGARDGAPQARPVASTEESPRGPRTAAQPVTRPELANLPLPSTSTPVEMSLQHAVFDSTKPSRQASKQASRACRYEPYQAVRRLAAQGLPEVHLARQLGLARIDVFPERAVPRPQDSVRDSYLPYLHQRLRQGCTVGSQLWRELQAQGDTGSRDQGARWFQIHRIAPTTPRRYLPTSTTATIPTPRPLSSLYLLPAS